VRGCFLVCYLKPSGFFRTFTRIGN
jgi:hypothetical protein